MSKLREFVEEVEQQKERPRRISVRADRARAAAKRIEAWLEGNSKGGRRGKELDMRPEAVANRERVRRFRANQEKQNGGKR
jgi:hypothetical protein